MSDVLIVGAGLAGTAAALMLERQGIDVQLVDAADPLPYCFKAEKFSPEQIQQLKRIGLEEILHAVSRHYQDSSRSDSSADLVRSNAAQYGMFYHDLVNSSRQLLPRRVPLKVGKVRKIVTSPDRQQVHLDDGQTLAARLLILASGNSANLLSPLKIERRMVSRNHSMAFGFSVAPCDRADFDFDEFVFKADHTTTRIAFISFFRIGATMRANLFVFWDAAEPIVREFLNDPTTMLDRLLQAVTRTTGPLRLIGHVDRCATHLQTVEGHLQPGLALIGDSFQTNCPATGTGMTKGLNDIECLCTSRVAHWLATPGMGLEKISQYYNDEQKVAYDRASLQEAIDMRKWAVDASLRWRMRRTARSWKRAAQSWWTQWSAGTKANLARASRS